MKIIIAMKVIACMKIHQGHGISLIRGKLIAEAKVHPLDENTEKFIHGLKFITQVKINQGDEIL